MRIAAGDLDELERLLAERFGKRIQAQRRSGEVTLGAKPEDLLTIMRELRDREEFSFTILVDLCVVDYSAFGEGFEGLFTKDAISGDAGRGRESWAGKRFAVVYHLLSLSHNRRLRVRVFLDDGPQPACDSVTGIWPVADWYEREAFDLFGVLFRSHPDLRRLLTDYGFIGHPFRKDFPVYGKVEMRYDPSQGRVIYQPVSIKPREVVPRIRRSDSFGNREEANG